MGLMTAISENNAKTIMGIDSSTNSLAFAIFQDGQLVKYGKINFDGNSSYGRLADSQNKILALADDFNVDYIAIEKSIYVRSVDTSIKMGMAMGVIIACLSHGGTDVVEVAPMKWQSYIKNPNLTKSEKQEIQKASPGKSKTWYYNASREFRKQRTIDWVCNKFGIDITDNDVSDAIGVGWYAVNHHWK